MKEVDIISKVVGRDTSGKAATFIPGAGAPSVDLDDYLMKKIWDSVFEVRTDGEGNTYLFEKLPFVTQHGITMYADGGDLNLPSIYAGLPIDGSTLIRDENGVLMINPDIDLGGGLTEVYWDDVRRKPTFALVATSGKYADLSGLPDLSVYATTKYLTAELKKYVTLNTEQTIAARKNFLNGLSVGGLGITKSQDDVIYLDANLVVRGGITMYATDTVDVPSIIDSLPIASTSAKGLASFDPNFFSVDANGNVSFIGSTGITKVKWNDVEGRPTLLSSFIDDVGYLKKSGGQMTGNIGYTLERDTTYSVGLPVSGSASFTDFYSFMQSSKTFIGSILNSSSGAWFDLISLRHTNGHGSDGVKYGMYIITKLRENDNLSWNKQINGTWQGERVILDSVNWSNYVNVDISGTIENANGLFRIDSRSSNHSPSSYMGRVTWHLKQVNIVKFPFGGAYDYIGLLNLSPWGDGSVKSQLQIAYDDNSNRLCFRFGNASNNSWGVWHEILSTRSDVVHSQLKVNNLFGVENITFNGNGEYFNKYGNLYLPSSNGDNSWNVKNSNGVSIFTAYSNGDILAGGGITMYSDIRKKTKLQDVELTLQQIAEAPLIEHYYNSDDSKTTHVGSIAQYWAGLNDWFCKLDNEGFYTMEIQNAALASAISIARELVKYESKTDRKIRLLKQRVKELEDKIEKFENN